MSSKCLIIDSDLSLATVLCDYLSSRGYYTRHLAKPKEAMTVIEQSNWDIIIMELRLEGLNGFELLREIRQRDPLLPVIILTTRTEREDQMRAFQLGCDDFVSKPFSIDILIYRIEAILRRVRIREENKKRTFLLNSHLFDAPHQLLGDRHLSARESDLLLILCRNEGEVVDKHRILSALWKEDNAFTARSLGVYINHLRHLLSEVGYGVLTVRKRGYKLVNEIEN